MRLRSAAYAAANWLRDARPAPLLALLVLAQFGVVAWLAFDTPHNGWVWYSGGDATEYWASQWSVAHGLIPPAYLGWGLPMLYAWIPLLAGASLLHGLPIVVLLHVVVLGPLALVLVWRLGDLLYGRIYAWSAATLWVAGPLLAVWGLAPRYQPRFEENFLAPHWAGLTDMADFPSLVAILACACVTVQAAQSGRIDLGAVAGILGGLTFGLKPSNGFFALPVAVLLAAWRRPRVALAWTLAATPALVTLVIWKSRGLGNIPILSAYETHREASGPLVGGAVSRYVPLDWHHLAVEWGQLREVFWDLRFLEFLLIASALGALRRNLRAGLFLVVWFVSYCVLKGMSNQAAIANTSYFRLTLPGLVAFLLLLPAIGFLVPGTRPNDVRRRGTETWARVRLPVATAVACVALVPLVIVLAEAPAPRSPLRLVRYAVDNTEAPVSESLRPRVRVSRGTVRLSWRPTSSPSGAVVAYGVIRTRADDGCSFPTAGAQECFLTTPIEEWTENVSISDQPGRGRFFYRVAATADNRANPESSDVMLAGPAVSVRLVRGRPATHAPASEHAFNGRRHALRASSRGAQAVARG